MAKNIGPSMNKTVEEIENDFWGYSNEGVSHLIKTIYKLRKKNIADFEIEDLRIMIGQNEGLPILVPLAIGILKENILAEGDFYEGDLLVNVLESDQKFWEIHLDLKKQVIILFQNNISLLKSFDTTEKIREKVFKAFDNFNK